MMYDVEPNDLIEKAAEELKKIEAIKPAPWAGFVKTGMHKERPPAREDWWYIRAAAILRVISMRGPVGVQKLRTKYGGKKSRGHRTEHFYKGSGNIIRKILQQLEKAELIKKGDRGVHKGRIITAKGISLLDKSANLIIKSRPKKEAEEPKVKEAAVVVASPVKVKEKKADAKKKEPEKKEKPKEDLKEHMEPAKIKNG